MLAAARVPVVAPTARDAVALAYRTLTGVPLGQAKIVRIRNTLELYRIWMCEHLWEESSGRPGLRSLSSPPGAGGVAAERATMSRRLRTVIRAVAQGSAPLRELREVRWSSGLS